jgi:hypothetical protein
MANIYFSTLDRKQLYELPILPEVMPELQKICKKMKSLKPLIMENITF